MQWKIKFDKQCLVSSILNWNLLRVRLACEDYKYLIEYHGIVYRFDKNFKT